MATKDEVGSTFGRLFVVSRAGSREGKATWRCICDCGNRCIVTGDELRTRKVQSCGCLRAEGPPSKHGHGSYKAGVSPTYKSWQSMHDRCQRVTHPSYKNYGGKGIRVCERWSSFEHFLADMGERPAGTSLDRVNNELGYSPENCRWATRIEQNNNRSQVRRFSYQGETLSLTQWCQRLNIPYHRTYRRIVVAGMPFEDAVNPEKLKTPK